MKRLIACLILGSAITALGCSGQENGEDATAATESGLYDKKGYPAENSLVATVAWDRCNPIYDKWADDEKGRIPKDIIHGAGLKKIELTMKAVGAVGCTVYGQIYTDDASVLHYGPKGEIRKGWPKNVNQEPRRPVDGTVEDKLVLDDKLRTRDSAVENYDRKTVTIITRKLSTAAGGPQGEQCTLNTPNQHERSNSPDGMRKDGSDRPIGVQDVAECIAEGAPTICPAAKRGTLNSPQAFKWLKPSNESQLFCHP
jgi:hypothetical protein